MSVKAHDKGPHDLFEKLRKAGKQVVLLENGWGGGRWSFVCVVDEKITVPRGEKGLVFIRDFIRARRGGGVRREAPFTAGFVGFLSYELGARWHGVAPFPRSLVPEAYFVYVNKVYAYKAKNISDRGGILPPAAAKAEKIKKLVSPQKYLKKIAAIKKYLKAGEMYQANFSQRFTFPYSSDAFALYKKVSRINPSPHQFFLETPEFALISNSPEKLFSLQKNTIETRPIKGTAPRGATKKDDEANARRLVHSAKDAAELAMIVDLARNDIGKIAVPGSVRLIEARGVERYSHVIHTVATISGRLATNRDWLDALYALFPGGSVTGCPKKRTMELLRTLENEPRDVYCGSAGFIDLSGDAEFNIMIRTMLLQKKNKRSLLTFHSGGGIVADSDAKAEYAELIQKARALQLAIES